MSDALKDGLSSEDDEEWVRSTPGWESRLATKEEDETTTTKKRQQKVITVDEILEADQRESLRKLKPRKTNPKLVQRLRATAHLYATSSEDDEEEWRKPTELLDELEKEVAVVAEEVEVEWGLEVLGAGTVEAPALGFEGPAAVQRALQVAKEAERETSLEEVARAGFLRPWACWRDEATIRWAYHRMAYSPDEALERACCSFLCDLARSSASTSPEWLPSPPDFQETFTTYGYREHKEEESETSDADRRRSTKPPPNFRSLLHFISEYLTTRTAPHDATHLSTLLRTAIHLSLDRELLPLLANLQSCILALLRSFTPESWPTQCASIAQQISAFTEKPHNAVHVLNILSGLGARSVALQRHLALLQLTRLSRRKTVPASAREVTSLFLNAQLRGSFVDFKKWFYLLVIADVFLWCNEEFLGDAVARYAWVKFLGACSVISVGDERPFASKLRNLASFLVTRYGEGELEEEERFEED